MNSLHPNRGTPLLIGIGLVLIGLLAGILTMLFVAPPPAAPDASPPRLVERVELGPRHEEPVPSVPMPDSGSQPVVPALNTLNRLFKDVAHRVTPAVVYIEVEVPPSREMAREWFHNFNDEELSERFLRQMPRQSVGSGVLISPDGYIITNHHVVEGATSITVTLSDKRLYEAEVIGVDTSTDLAVIKVDAQADLPVVVLGNADLLEVGEWVLAVGNPFRLSSTVTAGIVSALGRQVDIIDDTFRIEDFIQTDAAINPGNSGGALVNMQGQLVGINTAIATESGSYEGYGFAVPINLAERVARDLIQHGEVQRGYLGVTILAINARAASQLGLERIGGVYIRDVREGGAADVAGLRDGDVVLSIEGRSVDAPNELQSIIARHRPGEQINMEVWRRGKQKSMSVQLLGRDAPAYRDWFAREEEEQAPPMPERTPPLESEEVFRLSDWGLGVRTLNRRERRAFGTAEGVYLAYVEHGTLAAQAGLPRDVVVVRIDDEPVASVEDAVRLLGGAAESEEPVLLQVVRRDGIVAFFELETPS